MATIAMPLATTSHDQRMLCLIPKIGVKTNQISPIEILLTRKNCYVQGFLHSGDLGLWMQDGKADQNSCREDWA